MNSDFVFLAPDPNPGFYFTPALPSQRVLTLGSPLPAPPHPSSRPLVAPRLVSRPLDYSEPLQFFKKPMKHPFCATTTHGPIARRPQTPGDDEHRHF